MFKWFPHAWILLETLIYYTGHLGDGTEADLPTCE